MGLAPAGAWSQEPPESVTGELSLIVADDFDGRHSEVLYFVRDRQSRRMVELQFEREPPGHLRSGQSIRASGKIFRGVMTLRDTDLDYLPASNDADWAEPLAMDTSATGDQRTLVLLGDFEDVALDCNPTQVRDIMFTDPQNRSVDALHRESSHGQVGFTGLVRGPYGIPYTSGGACDLHGWADALESLAAAAGVDVASYSRKVLVLPRQNTCSGSGFGTLGGTNTRAWVMRCELPGLYAHELGHNLGMNHASTLTSVYGDGSDPLGMEVLGLRQHNAPHQDQMGWRDPSQFQMIDRSGFYDVSPISVAVDQAVAPVALVFPKPDTGDYYYVSYRAAVGFDANLSKGLLDRLHIHRYGRNGGRTFYVTGLLAGETFTDATNSISITHTGRSSNYATVEIRLAGAAPGPCEARAPMVSISPASQAGAPGTTLTYSASISNRDGASCPTASFTLSGSVPAGWAWSAAPGALTLAPGASSTATFSVTSASTAKAADYAVGLTASSSASGLSGTAAAVYLVAEACVRRPPAVALSPADQSGLAGEALRYALSITNQDGASCDASRFLLNHAVPGGWTAALSSSEATLAPGGSAGLTLEVLSSANAPPGRYGVSVEATDGASRSSGDDAGYEVRAAAVDSEPPSAPTGLAVRTQQRQLKTSLSWIASSDNVGVTGYRVWRDGLLLGTSTTTQYLDSTLVAGGTFTYRVTAIDAAGNVSAPSNAVVVDLAAASGGNSPGGSKGKK